MVFSRHSTVLGTRYRVDLEGEGEGMGVVCTEYRRLALLEQFLGDGDGGDDGGGAGIAAADGAHSASGQNKSRFSESHRDSTAAV